MTKKSYPIQNYIEKPTISRKGVVGDSIGTTLAKLKSSHDAVFIFDTAKTLKGLLSARSKLAQKQYPYNAKVERYVVKPPHITTDSPLFDIAKHMLATKIYILPIFEKKTNSIIGIVRASTLLKALLKNDELLVAINKTIAIPKPITASVDDTVNTVYHLLLKKHISRAILLDKEGDLAGIVSLHDIQAAFRAKTPRQRFGRREIHLKYASYFDDEQIRRHDGSIRMFLTEKVVSADHSISFKKILQKMIKAAKNSIVLTDGLKPVGFMSTHDILSGIAKLKKEEHVTIIWRDTKRVISAFLVIEANRLLTRFANRTHRHVPLRRIEIHVDIAKNAAGKVDTYEIKLHLFAKNGKKIHAKVIKWHFIKGIYEAIRKLNHQIRT